MQKLIVSIAIAVGVFVYLPDSSWANPTVDSQTHFTSIINFRDLAGPQPGYRTLDGHHIRLGLLFRSGNLEPNWHDIAVVMERLHIKKYDLRTKEEAAGKPDIHIPGTRYILIDIVGHDLHDDYDKVPDAAYEHRWMEDFYRDFVRLPYERAKFSWIVKDILTTSGSIIYHCAAGKDRTGWLSVILLSALGVPFHTIAGNYYLTNIYNHAGPFPANASKIRQIAWEGDDIADPDYLHASLAEVTKLYGTMDNYLRIGLGLDATILHALKAKYLS